MRLKVSMNSKQERQYAHGKWDQHTSVQEGVGGKQKNIVDVTAFCKVSVPDCRRAMNCELGRRLTLPHGAWYSTNPSSFMLNEVCGIHNFPFQPM